MADEDQAKKQFSKVVAKTWTDESFKQRFLENPNAVLMENGISPPSGIEIRVVEDTPQYRYLVLPPRPAKQEMSDEDLEGVAGGMSTSEASVLALPCTICW
jgi:Nitrile hydratase, alpha chain